MLASQPQLTAVPSAPQAPVGQLVFNWDEQPTAPVAKASEAAATPPATPDKPFTMDGPKERRVRKMKRISIGREPRRIPGGEAWESPDAPAQPATRDRQSRPSLSVGTAKRFSEPVRIGAAMLNLLRSYGITEEEIAAGIASYANGNCQAVAS
ncbi:MAG: hypothetical protein Aurels2KO_01890 [Aureliella sp.]